jgi:hypothetical protein
MTDTVIPGMSGWDLTVSRKSSNPVKPESGPPIAVNMDRLTISKRPASASRIRPFAGKQSVCTDESSPEHTCWHVCLPYGFLQTGILK